MNRMVIDKIKGELKLLANEKRAKALQRFFKTGRGEYGEGDLFLGVVVPEIRGLVAKYWREIEVEEVMALVSDKYHEVRLLGLLIWVKQFEKGDEETRRKVFELYKRSTKFINNWDLVDLTVHKIVGEYLCNRDDELVNSWAESSNMWERRMAVIAMFAWLRRKEAMISLKMVERMLGDKEDLIHKAAGWLLREVGKQCGEAVEEEFLKKCYRTMPRTMLRYAIERFEEKKRKAYLEGRI